MIIIKGEVKCERDVTNIAFADADGHGTKNLGAQKGVLAVTNREYHLWLGTTGREMIWSPKDEKWHRVRAGVFLAYLLNPIYKVAGAKDAKGLLKAIAHLPAPQLSDNPDEDFLGRLVMLIRLEECARLLCPQRGRKYKEGPGVTKRMLASMGGEGSFVDDIKTFQQAQLAIEVLGGKGKSDLLAYPLHWWLNDAWNKSRVGIDIQCGVYGFQVQTHNLWTAAFAEAGLLILFNVRKFRQCPRCGLLHREKDHSVCKSCRREQNRVRKTRSRKTSRENPLLAYLRQQKHRGKLTREEYEVAKEVQEVMI